MKNDVCIKAGSYCPICKGVVLADCRHDSSQFSVPMRYQRMEFNAQLQNEVEKLTRQRDALEMILRTIRSKHGAGIIALPEADVTRIDAALNRGEGQ